MGANNFKLFEIVNETIDDIYDFLVRYLRTFWIILFKFKTFITFNHEDQEFKHIVRPFNYLLFSFILLLLGLELVTIPYNHYYSDTFDQPTVISEANRDLAAEGKKDQEEGKLTTLRSDLTSLNTTSLIMKFLPTILFFILVSKIIEVTYRRMFKKPDAVFGAAYLYSIGFSCSAFAFLSFILYGVYASAMFLEVFEVLDWVDDLELAMFLYGALLIFFPAFLISRLMKIESIHFFKRFLSFGFLVVLNFMITFGYLLALINAQEDETTETYSEGVEFRLLGMDRDGSKIHVTLIHKDYSEFIFEQGSIAWVDAVNYYDSVTYGIFLTEANFVTGKETNNFLHLNSNRILELELDFLYENEYVIFDSLANAGDNFRLELKLLKDIDVNETGFLDFTGSDLLP